MLKRPPKRILVNSFDADTVRVVDGVIYISVNGNTFQFLPADVASCFRQCPEDAQRKVTRLAITLVENCECPQTYDITVVALPDYELYETDTTFDNPYLKEYEHPTGGAFTAIQAAAGLVAQINADGAMPVTAVQTLADGTPSASGTYITLTSKTDESDYNAYNPAGTVTVVTPFIRPVLNDTRMSKLFPIGPGMFASRPNLPHCGNYCKFYLKVKVCCSELSDARDISMDSALQGTIEELEFYVNFNATGYEANWLDKLLDVLPCLEDSSSIVESVPII